LRNDYYHFDAAKHTLTGEHSRNSYRLGDSVRVKVARVDLDDKKIDFEMLDNEGESLPSERPGRASKKDSKKGSKKGARKSSKPKSKKSAPEKGTGKKKKRSAAASTAKPASKQGAKKKRRRRKPKPKSGE
jgi:ribonuclease R